MSVLWTASAKADFDHQLDYARAGSPRGADRMQREVERAISLLELFPELGRLRRRGIRQLVIPRTPYVVTYRIVGNDVHITALFHAKQRRP